MSAALSCAEYAARALVMEGVGRKPGDGPYPDTLGRLRELYAIGRITLSEYERRIAAVLRGLA